MYVKVGKGELILCIICTKCFKLSQLTFFFIFSLLIQLKVIKIEYLWCQKPPFNKVYHNRFSVCIKIFYLAHKNRPREENFPKVLHFKLKIEHLYFQSWTLVHSLNVFPFDRSSEVFYLN